MFSLTQKRDNSKKRYCEQKTPCFAVYRPVCDLLEKVGCVPDQIVRAVLAVFGRISFLAAL